MKSLPLTIAVVAAAGLTAPAADAQSLRLGAEGQAAGASLQVNVGDVVRLQIVADFESLHTAGLAAYVTVPEGAFAVQDLGLPGQAGTQPFRPGPLYSGSLLPTNALLAESGGIAASIPGQQLDLAALFGPGGRGQTTGSGVVATFEMLALSPVDGAMIHIDDNPIRETKMVLSDGRTERRFRSTEGLAITVIDPLDSQAESLAESLGWARVKQVAERGAPGQVR